MTARTANSAPVATGNTNRAQPENVSTGGTVRLTNSRNSLFHAAGTPAATMVADTTIGTVTHKP